MLYCGVIFYFVVTGPIGALIYRLLLLTSWQWHYRTPNMVFFAQPVRKLISILVVPPAVIGGFITLLVSHPLKGFRAIKHSPVKDKTSLLLALMGGVLNVKLGGPAMYANKNLQADFLALTLLQTSEKAKPKTHHVLTTALGYMDASRQAWQDLLLGTITQVKATKSHLQCRCVSKA